jgi:hypothetical protein
MEAAEFFQQLKKQYPKLIRKRKEGFLIRTDVDPAEVRELLWYIKRLANKKEKRLRGGELPLQAFEAKA